MSRFGSGLDVTKNRLKVSLPKSHRISEEVATNGYIFLEGDSPATSSDEAISSLGDVEKLEGFEEIQELTPKDCCATTLNSYSGNFGLQEFPYHTDMAHWFLPPKYLALRCVFGSQNVKTRLIDGLSMLTAIGEENLSRTLVQPRRPINGEKPILRLAEKLDERRFRIRWDSLFIKPCSSFSIDIYSQVVEYLSSVRPFEFNLSKPGDTLIVDNWRMLHGRSSVPRADTSRVIHRAYLSSLK